MCCSGKIWGSYRGVVEDRDFSGMWHIVIGQVVREVLKDHIAFILGVKQCKKKLDSWRWRWHCNPSNNQKLLPNDTVLHPWRQLLMAVVIAAMPAGCVMVATHLILICFSLTVFFSRARKARYKRLVLRVFSEQTLIMEQYSKVQ